MNITENFRNYINSLNKIDSNNCSMRLDPNQALVSIKKRTCLQNFFGWFIYIITFTLVSRNRELDVVIKRFLEEAKGLNKVTQLTAEEKNNILQGIIHLKHIIKKNSGSHLSKVNEILATVKKIEEIATKSFPNVDTAKISLKTPTKLETPKGAVAQKNPPLNAPTSVIHTKISQKEEAVELFFKTFKEDHFESHKTWILSDTNQKFFETFELRDYENLISEVEVLKNLFSALEKITENDRAQGIFIQCTHLLFNQFQQPLSQNKALESEVYHYLSDDQQKQLPLKEYNAAMALFLDDRLEICKDSILMMQKYFELTDAETEECKKVGIFSEGSPQERTQKEVEEYFKDLFVLINDYNPDVIKKIIKELLDIPNCPLIDTQFSLLIKNCSASTVRQRFIVFLKESTDINHISNLIKRLLATDDQGIIQSTLEAFKIQPWKLWIFLAKNPEYDRNNLFAMNQGLEKLIKPFDESNSEQVLENLSQFFNISRVDSLRDLQSSSKVIMDSIVDGVKKLKSPQLIEHISFMSLGEIFAVLNDSGLRKKIKNLGIQNNCSSKVVNKFQSIIGSFKKELSEESEDYESFDEFDGSLVAKVLFPMTDNQVKKEPIIHDARKMKVFNGARQAIGALASSSPRRFKVPSSV